MYLGLKANDSLKELEKDVNIPGSPVSDFLKTCQSFYIELITDIVKRFDVKDNVFEVISIVDPKVAEKFEIKTLNHVFHRFPMLLERTNKQQVDNEWREHALLNYNELGLGCLKPA